MIQWHLDTACRCQRNVIIRQSRRAAERRFHAECRFPLAGIEGGFNARTHPRLPLLYRRYCPLRVYYPFCNVASPAVLSNTDYRRYARYIVINKFEEYAPTQSYLLFPSNLFLWAIATTCSSNMMPTFLLGTIILPNLACHPPSRISLSHTEIMSAQTVFSLPMDQIPRNRLDSLRVNVLKFDHTGDLLATADSDCVLRVYSFSQNIFILRKQFHSPIFALAWKTSYPSAFGRYNLYLGFGDGSIEDLSFSSKTIPVSPSATQTSFYLPTEILIQCDTETQSISPPQRGGLISDLAYNEGTLISCNSESVGIWRDIHDLGKFSNN